MKLLPVMQGLTSVKLPIHSARLLSKSRLIFWLVHQAAERKVNIKLKIWRLFFKRILSCYLLVVIEVVENTS